MLLCVLFISWQRWGREREGGREGGSILSVLCCIKYNVTWMTVDICTMRMFKIH